MQLTTARRMGRVQLVGAGPGDARLITARGLAAVREADVLLYDRLVSPALLGEAPLHAERRCVGKSPLGHRMRQEEITAALIAHARRGDNVVRLKGGDPFVFGRGGEEAEGLRRAGVPFEIVPGVTSVAAVPAYAGIPLTHRECAAGFAVWTAHRAVDAAPMVPIDAPTQVILMGVRTLAETVEALLRGGRPPATPVAIIVWGTTGRQRVVRATLGDAVAQAQRAGVEAPAVIVVGEVAALADRIAWWAPPGPWRGRRVVITRPVMEGDPVLEALETGGAEVVRLPVYVYEPDVARTAQFVEEMHEYSGCYFTTPHAVAAVWEAVWRRGGDARRWGGLRIAASDAGTARALQGVGLRAEVVGEGEALRAWASALAQAGRTLAVVGGEVAHGVRSGAGQGAPATCDVPEGLRQWEGGGVSVVAPLKAVPAPEPTQALHDVIAERMVDAVIFDTPEAERLFTAHVGRHSGDLDALLASVEVIRRPDLGRGAA